MIAFYSGNGNEGLARVGSEELQRSIDSILEYVAEHGTIEVNGPLAVGDDGNSRVVDDPSYGKKFLDSYQKSRSFAEDFTIDFYLQSNTNPVLAAFALLINDKVDKTAFNDLFSLGTSVYTMKQAIATDSHLADHFRSKGLDREIDSLLEHITEANKSGKTQVTEEQFGAELKKFVKSYMDKPMNHSDGIANRITNRMFDR